MTKPEGTELDGFGRIAGKIDDRIAYCPYCSASVYRVSTLALTKCAVCGARFSVVREERKKEVGYG